MEKTVEALIEEARRLPMRHQLALIERLARSIQNDLEGARSMSEELTVWDAMSDEALANFEKTL